MAYRNRSSNPRHVSPASRTVPPKPAPQKPSQARRAHKRRVRDEVLRHELELREHPPTREPEHAPRRVRRQRTPFWKYVRRAVGVLVLLGVGELGVASLTADQFKVKSFEITGCEVTDIDRVHELAQPLVGQNWIRAGRGQIEQQIEKLPTVKAAHVSRVLDWPPRLHVTVEERVPFAKIGAGDDWWVVDENGLAFRRPSSNDKALYAITGPELVAHLGKTLPQKEWRSITEIASALRSQGEQEWALRRVYFDKDGSVALRLTGGFHDETLIRLGTDHWDEKIVRARQALDYFERTGRRAAVLNLVSYEMPQWTPRAVHASSTSPGTPPSTPVAEEGRDQAANTSSET